jgi:hypothetical protein
MSENILRVGIAGHVTIEDDLGNVLLDKSNAVHPQNLSRIISRALSNEPNSTVYKLALGNGGTYVDATGATSFRRPNDGISPDMQGWQSRLYNETYNEVVDEGSPLLGQGVGAYPGGDGSGIDGVRSIKLPTGESQIIVTCVLNSQEPTAQLSNSLVSTTTGTYTFDELGLFTAGLPAVATQGYQDVVLSGGKSYTDVTYLTPGVPYYFAATVDGAAKVATITLPLGTGTSGAITYTDLKQAIDSYTDVANPLGLGLVAQVSQPGVNTLGNLRLRSLTSGTASSVVITDLSAGVGLPAGATWLFTALKLNSTNTPVYVGLGTAVTGQPQGEEDNPAYPQNERERLLTHLIFSPLQKDASRSWKITYKLTVIVQQSDAIN